MLVVANIVTRCMSVFNTTTITTMVDRWRPETYSFHLSCGEMTMTLEEVAMILGLSIKGQLVTSHCDSTDWRVRVATFLGREPTMKVSGVKRREAGVRITLLHGEFTHCPPDVDESIVSWYVRA
jgi:hypothetical protein